MPYNVIAANAGDYSGALLPTLGSITDLTTIAGFIGAWMAPTGSGNVTSWPATTGTGGLSKASGAENPTYAEVDDFRVVQFAGLDDMTFTPSALLDVATEMTFGIRAKFHTGPARGIIFGDNSNNLYIDISNNNTLRFATGGGSAAFVSAPFAVDNRWHTIICTHSNTESRIEIDGVVTTGAGAAMNAGAILNMGAWAGGSVALMDIQKVILASSDTFGLSAYDMVKTFLG